MTVNGFEPRKNNRGNFACPYCKHKSWKTKSSAEKHIRNLHYQEALVSQQKAEAEEKIRKANIDKWQAESRASRLQKELDDIKKANELKKKEKRYSAVVYCPNCLSVDSVNIVEGQKIGDGGCFRCHFRGGGLVTQVNVNFGTYQIGEAK